MTSVRRALALSFLERYLTTMLALASNMILARLLTPGEIGLFSVTLAVIGIAQVLREFGIGSWLIQQKDLTEAQVSTAFGMALLLGGIFFGVVYMSAPLVGRFYGEPSMVLTMRIAAVNFLLVPFGAVRISQLRRAMRFKALLYLSLGAALMTFVVTVALAWAGFGANSMAIGSLAQSVGVAVGAWLSTRDQPMLWPSLSQWRPLLRFGGQTALTNVVSKMSMNVNDLAIAKILGFASVAVLSRAQGLMNLFHRDAMNAVHNVAYPAYAKAHREGLDVDRQHTAGMGAVIACAWPFYGFLALFPLEIMRVMFGHQWDEAVPLVPVYCLAGAIAATSSLVLQVVLAVGQVNLVTKATIFFQPVRALAIVAAAVFFQSPMACAVAYAISSAVYAPFVYVVKHKCLPTDVEGLFAALRQSATVALLSLIVPVAVSLNAGLARTEPLPIYLLIGAAVAAVLSWILALMWTRHPLSLEPTFQRALSRITRISNRS